MKFSRLVQTLSRPEAYPHAARDVQVRQTHLSAVFLAGKYAYKIKKPVKFAFADYSTEAKRKHYCELELQLNRRLAKGVYLQTLRLGGEPAVKMRRLPDDRNFASLLKSGKLTPILLKRLARKLTAFYRSSQPCSADFSDFEAVRNHWERNLKESSAFVGQTLTQAVMEKFEKLGGRWLKKLRLVIAERENLARDGHGDLRLEHIYDLKELVVMDCIEFNEAFRCGDPLLDIAFLVMDLEFQGRGDLAGEFKRAFARETGWKQDELLDFYVAYRHIVRGKVNTLQGHHGRAQAHFLAALVKLAPPEEKPGLVLVGGLPGSGKSRLSKELVKKAGYVRISSDEMRKRLAGIPPTRKGPARIYGSGWSDATYSACLRLAEDHLCHGRKVLVDATFAGLKRRKRFLELARQLGVPFKLLLCQASEATIKKRIKMPERHASDAGWEIYRLIKSQWQANDAEMEGFSTKIRTDGRLEPVVKKCLTLLEAKGKA